MQPKNSTFDLLKWPILLLLFGIGMTILTFNLICEQPEWNSNIFVTVSTIAIAFSSYILSILTFLDFIRAHRQMATDLSTYTEYQRQQTEGVIETERYARHINLEHFGNMFVEIYVSQIVSPMTLSWILLIISCVTFAITQQYIFIAVILFAIYLMFTGFWGTACRIIKKQIIDGNMNLEQVKRDYMHGVMYTFNSGYFNVGPNYTFIISGKDSAVIPNENLGKINSNIKQEDMNYTGFNVGNVTHYSITITTKQRKGYTVTCDAVVGTLILEAIERKIAEFNDR